MTDLTQADWDCRTVPGVARRPKCGLKHCASCSPHTAARGTETLEDRGRRLEAALKPFAECAFRWTGNEPSDPNDTYLWASSDPDGRISVQHILDARKALGKPHG